MSRLSRDYEVQGLLFGTEPAGQLPFPVRKGTKEEGDRFGIQGIPSLVVLSKETVKYIFVGDRSINDAPLLLRAFQDGALTVSELLKQNPSGDVTVAGWVLAHGDYFSDNSQFILSDRQKNIRVQPWLPREAAKSRLKQTRPRLMSDVVGKPVVLTGRLVTGEGAPRFQVKGEKRVE